MDITKNDDSLTLSKYDFNINIIDNDIWKWTKRYAKNVKKMNQMVRNLLASKRASRGVKYQSGVRAPRNIQ